MIFIKYFKIFGRAIGKARTKAIGFPQRNCVPLRLIEVLVLESSLFLTSSLGKISMAGITKS